MYRVELSKRALRDLRRIDHKSRKRLLDLLEHDLATESQPANLDIKPLAGRACRGCASVVASTASSTGLSRAVSYEP